MSVDLSNQPVLAGEEPVVYVVDDNEMVLRSLERLITSSGLRVRTFSRAADFLDSYIREQPGCLVLDVRIPEMSGLSLLEHLRGQEMMLPVLMISGHADVQSALRAMRAKAFDFLEKPFSEQILLDRIHEAIEIDSRERVRKASVERLKQRINKLTPREKQVMGLVVAGHPNKTVGSKLGLSQKTVEIHRANVMSKMEAKSLADLVKMYVAVYGNDHGAGAFQEAAGAAEDEEAPEAGVFADEG